MHRIDAWDDTFQSTFSVDDPASSAFASMEQHKAYVAEGKAIVVELRKVWSGEIRVDPQSVVA